MSTFSPLFFFFSSFFFKKKKKTKRTLQRSSVSFSSTKISRQLSTTRCSPPPVEFEIFPLEKPSPLIRFRSAIENRATLVNSRLNLASSPLEGRGIYRGINIHKTLKTRRGDPPRRENSLSLSVRRGCVIDNVNVAGTQHGVTVAA